MYSKSFFMFFTLVMTVAAVAQAAADSHENAVDKTRYRALIREVQSVEVELSKIQDLAVKEVKQQGEASLETKSNLQSLENKRNRLMDRLLMLSLRYGWDIPDRNAPVNSSVKDSTEERDRIFAPADEIIKKRFAQEAREIAGQLKLPLISLHPVGHTVPETKEGGKVI